MCWKLQIKKELKKEIKLFQGWEGLEFPRKSKCHKKWVYFENWKKKERKVFRGWELREKRDWFSTSDFPLEPPFVTVADAKFKSSLNFIQFPSSSSRKNKFHFHMDTVVDAKSLKAL